MQCCLIAASAQSPMQRSLINDHPDGKALFVEGGFSTWLRGIKFNIIQYCAFQLNMTNTFFFLIIPPTIVGSENAINDTGKSTQILATVLFSLNSLMKTI